MTAMPLKLWEITPDLDFLDNVTQIVDTRFADRFSLRFDEAVRSAR